MVRELMGPPITVCWLAMVALGAVNPTSGPAGGSLSPAPAQSYKAVPSAASPQTLQILSDTVLKDQPLRWAVDVRWAGDQSVVLALKKSGVAEYALDGKSAPKQLIPGDQAPGGFWQSQHVAVSAKYVAAGAWLFTMTWRPLDSAVRKEAAFEAIDDLDIQGSRAVVAGPRRDAQRRFAPEGGIVWLGSLDKDLADLRPLLFDAGGPGAPNANACGSLMLGATRFLADGSLLVVPGVQPGVYHFDSQGKLFQTLDTVKLGIDTDCGGISKEQRAGLKRDPAQRQAWMNERRIVDDVLPLPAGPGLLIRSVHQGEVQWALKVLHPDGSATAYDLPVRGLNAFSHLKGDFRKGRMVLLLWGYPPDRKPDDAPLPHLLIASPPASWPVQESRRKQISLGDRDDKKASLGCSADSSDSVLQRRESGVGCVHQQPGHRDDL